MGKILEVIYTAIFGKRLNAVRSILTAFWIGCAVRRVVYETTTSARVAGVSMDGSVDGWRELGWARICKAVVRSYV